MVDNPTFLGLHFSSQHIALAQITNTPAGKVVTKLGSISSPMPFTLQMMEEDSNSTQFAEAIDALMLEKGISDQNTACAVNASMSLLKRFPIDKGSSTEEIREQIDWEIQNNLISSPDEYLCKVLTVPAFSGNGHQERALLMVRKKVINYFKKIIAQTRLEINLLDIDVFAAEYCWQKNYDSSRFPVSALVNVGSEFIAIGLFFQDYFLGYQSIFNQDRNISTIVNSISQKLKAMGEETNWLPPNESVSRVFCYGELASDDLVMNLQKRIKGTTELLNPFKIIPVVSEVETSEEYKTYPILFVEPIGLAFRQT